MVHVLVTGANGFVGRALCRDLAAAGLTVTAAARRDPPEGVAIKPLLIADIGTTIDRNVACDGVDAVVHLAARVPTGDGRSDQARRAFEHVNVAGTRRLAEAAAAVGVRRFVFLSTVKVHGEATREAPFREGAALNPRDAYAESKWHAERALHEVAKASGLEVVVLRPPLIYGRGVKAYFRALLSLCDSGLPLPLAAAHNRRSLLYLGNLTDAIRLCLAHPQAGGQTYLLRDGENLSTAELVRRLRAALGRPARLFSAPPGLMRMAAALLGRSEELRRLNDPLTVDDTRIRGELAWQPPFSADEGLAATVAWYRSRPRQ